MESAGDLVSANSVTLPTWLAILLLVLLVLGTVAAPFLTYRAAVKGSQATKQTTTQANELTASKSNRELILQAIDWTRSPDELTRTQGWAVIEGLSQMPGLSKDDAVLFTSVTRPIIERRLAEGRRVEEIDEEDVRYARDLGPMIEGDEDEDAASD